MSPISVPEADALIHANLCSLEPRRVPLEKAAALVLCEDLIADRPFPPFDRVAMDGIALRFSDYQNGLRTFHVCGIQAAGAEAKTLPNGDVCMEAMTGAVLPKNADCVVPVEDLKREGDSVRLPEFGQLKKWQHVHREAKDCLAGSCLAKAGEPLYSAAVALAATVGSCDPLVLPRPRVGFYSTGDEIVGIDQVPLPHQIRRSNAEAILAALQIEGFHDTQSAHFADTRASLEAGIKAALGRVDVLIFSGGVSMGRFDFVPDVLRGLGVDVHFHKVRQRPGKPLLFGSLLFEGKLKRIFALPGNPVSSLITFHRYVMPALKHISGLRLQKTKVLLSEEFKFAKTLAYFLPVRLYQDDAARVCAAVVPTSGSGDFAPLIASDGFVEIPEDMSVTPAGSLLDFYPWGGLGPTFLKDKTCHI
jgi:molybdopterin molybdotransferase